MQTEQLTIQLPTAEIHFLEEYTKQHHLTISEVLERLIQQFQLAENYVLHPGIEKMSGILPGEVDARKEYYEDLEEKYR